MRGTAIVLAIGVAAAGCGEPRGGAEGAGGEAADGGEAAPQPAAREGEVGPESPRVRLQTSRGDIVLALYARESPATVENFLAYVREGFYDGLVFHRIIDGFMIQAGGFTPALEAREPPRPPIRNESDNGLANLRGTISMARTQDPHSASAQFFINHRDNGFLDHEAQGPGQWGYAVFGRVVEGMEVVDAIAAVPTGAAGGSQGRMEDVPAEPVLIRAAAVVGGG